MTGATAAERPYTVGMATTDPRRDAVPGATFAWWLGRVALGLCALAGIAAAGVVWGWWMSLLVTHLGGGVLGALGWCLVVLMAALALAAVAGAVWATLETDVVRRRMGLPPRGPLQPG